MTINKACCIDLYHGDEVLGDNDEGFVQAKAAGVVFLDHKASDGVSTRWDNRCAFRRRRWMDGAAIRVVDVDGTVLMLPPKFGFYHFNGTGSAADEAANFIAACKAAGYVVGDDLCLDWERIGASGYQRDAAFADEFCQRVEQEFGFWLKVYGGDVPREELSEASDELLERFAERRPWVCQYGGYNAAEVPRPWRGRGHQWQDDGDAFGPGPHRIPGIIGNVDNSTVVDGMTVATLHQTWAGGQVIA